MYWYPTIYALISLAGAAVPAIVGSYAWQRRGKPGATALAALMWLFALWSIAYAAELGTTSEAAGDTLYEIRTVLFLPVAPL